MMFASRDGSSARTLARRTSSDPGTNHSSLHARRTTIAHAAAPDHLSMPSTPSRSVPSPDGHRNAESTERRTSVSAYVRGKRIFGPGQGKGLVYIVRDGCVRLNKTLSDGRSITVGLLGPNTIFTQESDPDGLATGVTAEALVDTTLSIVSNDDLAAVIAEAPELATAVVTATTRRLTQLQTLVEHLLVRDTTVRLAATLLTLADSVGRPQADGMVNIILPLTHQALAGMIGSNRVTVTRKLSELQTRGAVQSLGRNQLRVNPDVLRQTVKAASEGEDADAFSDEEGRRRASIEEASRPSAVRLTA
jgi:CRP-like cAMP-binding protein